MQREAGPKVFPNRQNWRSVYAGWRRGWRRADTYALWGRYKCPSRAKATAITSRNKSAHSSVLLTATGMPGSEAWSKPMQCTQTKEKLLPCLCTVKATRLHNRNCQERRTECRNACTLWAYRVCPGTASSDECSLLSMKPCVN